MVFGRRKKNTESAAQQPEADVSDAGADDEPAAVEGLRSNGPFDSSEKTSLDGYLDLGALRIMPREGLQLRLEVEENTQRVVAVTLDFGGSSLPLQAFAAPKTEGLWGGNPHQIGPPGSPPGGAGGGGGGPPWP